LTAWSLPSAQTKPLVVPVIENWNLGGGTIVVGISFGAKISFAFL
jgi:hypothetical protein